jgi:short-subunit dehydrogenase
MIVKDKIAIVTGASSGIGLATAKLLTNRGAKVALVARSRGKLVKLSKELPGSFVAVADMAVEKDIKNMVKKVLGHFGRIDILVNNAGQGYDAQIENINIKTFHQVFDLDLVGPLAAMQQVIPIMRGQGGGVIVNISSGTALMYLPNMGGYSSLKRALASISLTAREELKKDKTIVSVVYPYITMTDFEKNTIKHGRIEWSEGGGSPHPPDTAEYVAEKILEVIKSEKAEQLAHDWMKNLRG